MEAAECVLLKNFYGSVGLLESTEMWSQKRRPAHIVVLDYTDAG